MVWNEQAKKEIPEGWEFGPLKTLLANLKDGTHNPPKRVAKGIPLLTGTMFGKLFLSYKDASYITYRDYAAIHSTYQPEEWDIVMTKIGTIGKVNYLTKSDLPLAIHCNSALLKFKMSYKGPFSLLMSKDERFQFQLKQCKGQSIQEFVSLDRISNINVELPSPKIVEHFNNHVISIFDSLFKIREEILLLIEIRDSLLPLLMNGQVTVL